MKNLKFRGIFRSAIVLLTLVVCLASCGKDEEPTLDYVGTWIAVESIPTVIGLREVRDVMTFTENTVVDLMQTPGWSAGNWIDLLNLKGSISVSGNLMTVTIAEIGITSLDPVLGLPTGTIINYKDGNAEFEDILSEYDLARVFDSEFIVSGNKLTLKTDKNDDGDYEDELEITVYTRQ